MSIRRGQGLRHGIHVYEYAYLKAHVLRRAHGTSTKPLLRLFQGAINGTCDTAKLYLKAYVLRLARGVLKRLPNHLPLACLPRPLCMPHNEAPRNRAVVKGS